ncbi:MAG: cysteine synthase A [Myxococcales bacterium]|nr:cysteine synthase A [Myxococcales bacterium]MCB9709526.1 cysteine synthase A [Myxococcales bacterium]
MTDKIVDSVVDLIGHTPLVRLSRVGSAARAEVCAKLEASNPGGSVKDRPAWAMVHAAEEQGLIASGSTLIEATSGNTGISLAMIAAVRGYHCMVIMPEDMSVARRHILKTYGAEVVLTRAADGMAGAVARAEELLRTVPGAFMLRQFQNEANPEIHARTTGEEIWRATGGILEAFVAGVGTGGTITGVARTLKKHRPALRIIAVEPRGSAILSGGRGGLHGIPGLGAGFIPDVLDRSLIDEIVTVSDLDAERMSKRLASEEGLLVGPSSGANVHVALAIAQQLRIGERVVTVLCDTAERYLC